MSIKISQLLDVIAYVQKHHESRPQSSVTDLRIEAVREVAETYRVLPQTVHDKFLRCLNTISTTAEFDALLADYLARGSALESELRRSVIDFDDIKLIDQTFNS